MTPAEPNMGPGTPRDQHPAVSAVLRQLAALAEAEEAVASVVQPHSVEQTNEVIRSGRTALVRAAEHILSLESALAMSEEVLAELEKRADDIRRVITLIDDVAAETHLLALNAKILAAQAGQSGAGFSVVASKLMELANSTRAGTGEVEGILGGLAEESSRASQAVHGSVEKVREAASLADGANDAFDALAGVVSELAKRSRRATPRLENLRERRNDLATAVDELKRAYGSPH